jgi:hypothetical protein
MQNYTVISGFIMQTCVGHVLFDHENSHAFHFIIYVVYMGKYCNREKIAS